MIYCNYKCPVRIVSVSVSCLRREVSVLHSIACEKKVKNWKQTSCICHKEACHRTLCAHLAQNSIPTCKIKHTHMNLISKNTKFHFRLLNWKKGQNLQQHPLRGQMYQTFQTKEPLHHPIINIKTQN
jgi:hypothetical protein